jgi:exoribonuclease-2
MDLLCHQQIRSWIGSGAYRELQPLGEDEVLLRAGAAEAAASAATRTEKASRAHWMAVFLSMIKNSCDNNAPGAGAAYNTWDGVILDRKGSRGTVIIPALGIETQISLRGNEEPNEMICLRLSSVKIPEGEASFTLVS